MFSFSAFATTTLDCKSSRFVIQVADVEVGEQYVSDKIIALSLDVDGQERKFELSVTKSGAGKYSGRIFSGKLAEAATCTRK